MWGVGNIQNISRLSTVWYMYQGLEIAASMAAVTLGWLESAHEIYGLDSSVEP